MTSAIDGDRPRALRGFRVREAELASLLRIDDTAELESVLEELQTLLHRCGYHVDLLRDDRLETAQRRRSRTAKTPASKGPPRRGRRPGSANWANRQLGLGLATLWAEWTGTRPTRRFDPIKDREYGPYRAFVETVMGVLPPRLRLLRKGGVPEVDHMVRISIEEWKAAQTSGGESRRRGLLAEERWIGPT